jgi:hypothetical protein
LWCGRYGPANGPGTCTGTAAIGCKFVRTFYRPVTLFPGNIVFDEIGVLQAHEFDGKAIFDVADDTPLRFADRYDDADRRPQVRNDTDGGTRLGKVDYATSDIRAIWQYQPCHRIPRGEAVMTATFRQ